MFYSYNIKDAVELKCKGWVLHAKNNKQQKKEQSESSEELWQILENAQ